MKCISSYQQTKNVNFGASGHIVRKQYYQITDRVINAAVQKNIDQNLDIRSALAEAVGKYVTAEHMKKAYGDSYEKVCELYTTVKENFPSNSLREALKKLLSSEKLADEKGNLTRLPLKVLVIKPGDEPLADNIYADRVINNGVNGLKSVYGNSVSVSNVEDVGTEVQAYYSLMVADSKLKNMKSYGKSHVTNSTAEDFIESFSDIFGRNISAKRLKSSASDINLYGINTIGKVEAYDSIFSHHTLVADDVEAKTGALMMSGVDNKIGALKAPRGIFTFHSIDGSNFIGDVTANAIEAVNLNGNRFEATEGELLLLGYENKVDELISNKNMMLENIITKNVTSNKGSVFIEGAKNVVEETLFAKKNVKAENLEVGDVICEIFEPTKNVNVLGYLYSNLSSH